MTISAELQDLKIAIDKQLNKGRSELLERFVKSHFILTQNWINSRRSQGEINSKIEEWNELDNWIASEYAGYLSSICLNIRGDEIAGQSLNLPRHSELTSDPNGGLEVKKWHFSFPVLLKGRFEEVYVNGARFENGFEIGCDICERTNQISSYFEVKKFYFNEVEVSKEFSVFGAKFFEDVRFFSCKFIECPDSGARFFTAYFFGKSNFDIKLSQSNFNISDSVFADDADFFIHSSTAESETESGSDIYLGFNKFEKNFQFRINSGKAIINKLRLCSSDFLGKAIIFQMDEASWDVKELDLDWAIFRDVLVIKPKRMTKVPDFSKANFIDSKKLSLREVWKVQEGDIKQEEEPKFLFLKKYFAEQGNHFKEQEYFSYEMTARKKLLCSKVCSSSSEFEKNFFVWLKNLSEFFLFFAYKCTSNFGMSWARPLFGLLVSSRIMALRLDQILPISFAEKVGEFFGFGEVSTIGFWEALTKTLLPLSTAKIFDVPYDWVGNIHCLINGILIFLFILGIRNKFKIK